MFTQASRTVEECAQEIVRGQPASHTIREARRYIKTVKDPVLRAVWVRALELAKETAR